MGMETYLPKMCPISDDSACFFPHIEHKPTAGCTVNCESLSQCQLVWGHTWKDPTKWQMLKCVFLLFSLRVSAEMLGYSYELDSPYSGPKNRAVPNFMMRSLVRPLQRMRQNIEVLWQQNSGSNLLLANFLKNIYRSGSEMSSMHQQKYLIKGGKQTFIKTVAGIDLFQNWRKIQIQETSEIFSSKLWKIPHRSTSSSFIGIETMRNSFHQSHQQPWHLQRDQLSNIRRSNF